MTDIMKLADDYANKKSSQDWALDFGTSADIDEAFEDQAKARAALQSAIEALQSKLGDAIQSSAHWQHQFTELQAENERLKAEAETFKRSWLAFTEQMKDVAAERDQLQSKLDELGKGEPVATVTDNFATDYSEIGRTYQAPIPIGTKLYAAPKALEPDVDWLSNVIRQVDGNNKLGAGALAEKIIEAISAHGIGGTP